MDRFCRQCGAELPADARFCSACGEKVPRNQTGIIMFGIAGVLVGAGLVWGVLSLRAGQLAAADSTVPVSTTRHRPATTVLSREVPATTITTTDHPTTTSHSELDSAELARVYGDAVWRIETDGCDTFGTGSGFAISPNHVVTNQHVIDTDSTPALRSRNGTLIEGRVMGSSLFPDVALIEVDEPISTVLDWAPTGTVAEGDRIVTLGYPAPQHDFTVTPGNVLSFGSETGASREFLRTDGQLDYGNSGGPALNLAGGVVGVVTSVDINAGGLQPVPQIYASDLLRPVVEAMLASPTYPEPPCDAYLFDYPEYEYPEYEYDDYYYGDFWTGIVGSLPTDQYDYDKAYDRALAFFVDTGLWADVLLSDLYPSLNPGYWAVYSGFFLSSSEADLHCEAVSELGYDCYSRWIGWG